MTIHGSGLIKNIGRRDESHSLSEVARPNFAAQIQRITLKL
jgi:hypothetical protein